MKKYCVLLSLALVLFFVSARVGQAGEKKFKLAFFIAHVDNEFMSNLADFVESAAKANGQEITVYAAHSDPATQISQVETALGQGLDGVLLDPASFDGITAAVDACAKAKVPVVAFHERLSVQDRLASFVGPAFKPVGVAEIKQVIKDLNEKGEIGVVYGALGHTAQIEITDGYTEVLKDYAGIKTVFDGTGEWVPDKTLSLVENWLSTGRKIDAIVCNNDGMALGAWQACVAANRKDIKVYGYDAVPQVIQSIKEGGIRATVFTNSKEQAKTGVEVLLKVIKGEKYDKDYITQPIVITKENVNQYF
ncbi:MAG: substrate-binding domain-containing protein [Planctomycetota bacterium]|jgi:ribose transport system substrate-binding protein/inositol transport system substrate-binding protein|nr:substrate-binding domain-containing protein [Planctomycetota bacterium]